MVNVVACRRSARRIMALMSVAALGSLAAPPVLAAPDSSGPITITATANTDIAAQIATSSDITFQPGNYHDQTVVISSVQPNTTIRFASGSYTGLNFVVNASGITFESASASPVPSTQATFSGESGAVFTLGPNATDTRITDLSFTGIADPNFSGVITVPGTGVSDVTISNNNFTNLQDAAIGYHGNPGMGSGWTISDNTITGISGGNASNGPSAIWLGNLASSTITGNVITGTTSSAASPTAANTAWAGILLTGGVGTLSGTIDLTGNQSASTNQDNTVSSNTVEDVWHEGIQIAFGKGLKVLGNYVSGAGLSRDANGQHRDGAISLFNPNQSGIEVQDNRLSASYQGLTVGQTLFNRETPSGISAQYNAIEAVSGSLAAGNYATSGTLLAADNWWGPGVTPSSVVSAVYTDPYLSSLTLSLSSSTIAPGSTTATASASLVDSTSATVTGASVPILYEVFPAGSTTAVASGTEAYGSPFPLPTLQVGTYTVTAQAIFGTTASSGLSASSTLTVASPSSPVTTPVTPPPAKGQGTVTPSSGGTVKAQGNNGTTVDVTIPGSSFTVPVTLSVTPTVTLPSGAPPVSQALQVVSVAAVTSAGTAADYPAKPVTLTFTLAAPPSAPVSIQFWNPLLKLWQVVPNVTVTGTTVTVTISHLTTFALVPASSTTAVQRLNGKTRMGTSVQASEAAYPDGAAAAVLANAGQGVPSPDALAAAGLAGALHAPVLLTPANVLSASVKTALGDLGVKTVYVIGGPHAISDTVVSALQGMGLTVVRQFEGKDRFQTAALIDAYLYQNNLTASKTVFVANGATMIDAMSASPVIYHHGSPLLLVNTGQTSVASSVLSSLQADGVTQAVVLGGPNAVNAGIENQLAAALGTSAVTRIYGQNRDQTAVAIDQHYFTNPSGVVVSANGSEGSSFVDALSASALASMNDVPIVLSNPMGLAASTDTYLKQTKLQMGWVMGGPLALTAKVDAQLTSLISP